MATRIELEKLTSDEATITFAREVWRIFTFEEEWQDCESEGWYTDIQGAELIEAARKFKHAIERQRSLFDRQLPSEEM